MAGPFQPVAVPTRDVAWGSLWDSARRVPHSDADTLWEAGVSIEPEQCDATQAKSSCDDDAWADPEPCIDAVEFTPITVQGEYAHSTLTVDYEKGWQRAEAALALCRSAKAAHELWTGDLNEAAGSPFSSLDESAGLTIISEGVPLCPIDALNQTIGALGSADCPCGTTHFIHTTSRVAAEWFADSANGVFQLNRTLYSFNGHVIVIDGGYPGTGPDGSDDSPNEWVFTSGPVDLHHSPVRSLGKPANPDEDGWNPNPPGIVSIADNQTEFYAQQVLVPVWDPHCCRFAVEVDLAVEVS